MYIKYNAYLLFSVLTCLFITSCNKDSNTYSYDGLTSDAQIYSFSLKAPFLKKGDVASRSQDSLRILKVNETNYSIDQENEIIFNRDSLPYKTELKNVLVTATFNAAYGVAKVEVTNKDTTYTWNRSDSIDFSKAPIIFDVYSWNNTQKRYNIDIRIHKVDPALIVWKQLPSLLFENESKTILFEDNFYTYILKNNKLGLNTNKKNSTDNIATWNEETVTGLPNTIKVESVTFLNNIFNIIDNSGGAYTSTDGKIWKKQDNGYNVVSIIGALPALRSNSNEDLLVVIQKNNNLLYAKGSNLANIKEVTEAEGTLSGLVPVNFPQKGFSSFTNNASSISDRMLVVAGGTTANGNVNSARWLIKNTASGIQITSFTQNLPFTVNAGLSIFSYNNLFYILNSRSFYISENKGETWKLAPSEQVLDNAMTIENNASLIVNNNYMWIFGGKNKQGKYINQVWRGKLNSLNN